jgi:hypothetical protein
MHPAYVQGFLAGLYKNANLARNLKIIEELRRRGLIQDEAVTVYRGGVAKPGFPDFDLGQAENRTFAGIRETLKKLKQEGMLTAPARRARLLERSVGGATSESFGRAGKPVIHTTFDPWFARGSSVANPSAPARLQKMEEYKIPVKDLLRRFIALPADELGLSYDYAREQELSLLGDISKYRTRQLPALPEPYPHALSFFSRRPFPKNIDISRPSPELDRALSSMVEEAIPMLRRVEGLNFIQKYPWVAKWIKMAPKL